MGILGRITSLRGYLDIQDASRRIKDAIWFRGPNVWILAFAIVLASVGLNVNSVAVIIGAMLVSPVMGPIVGIGLSIGTYDTRLLRAALRNLILMVTIAVVVSALYFLISPLRLYNPSELLARTSPTIYDVIIAFFGGAAGILENCRKERGTVLSGVAIATALMPPLCTAGFGLATLQGKFFFGAMYLFLINSVFIILATYAGVKLLRFPSAAEGAEKASSTTSKIITRVLLVLFIIPSIVSAVSMVKDNNFEQDVRKFVDENEKIGNVFILDNYRIFKDDGRKVEITVIGDQLTETDRQKIIEEAARYGIEEGQLVLRQSIYSWRMPALEDLGMPDPSALIPGR